MAWDKYKYRRHFQDGYDRKQASFGDELRRLFVSDETLAREDSARRDGDRARRRDEANRGRGRRR
jgi:hypothetical protein